MAPGLPAAAAAGAPVKLAKPKEGRQRKILVRLARGEVLAASTTRSPLRQLCYRFQPTPGCIFWEYAVGAPIVARLTAAGWVEVVGGWVVITEAGRQAIS